MADSHIGVGIIGTGTIAQAHLTGLAGSQHGRATAVFDVLNDRAQTTAQQFGIPYVATSIDDLVARNDVDAVIVCTPPFAHADPTIRALEAGKHVLCEKPFALDVREAEQMVQTAARVGKYLACCSGRGRFAQGQTRARQMLDSGELGDVYYIRSTSLRFRGRPGHHIFPQSTWFMDKDRAGGGVIMDGSVYTIDSVLWLLGNPRVLSVTAAMKQFTEEPPPDAKHDVEDHAVIMLQCEGGKSAVIESAWVSNMEDADGMFIFGTKAGLKFNPLRKITSARLDPSELPAGPSILGADVFRPVQEKVHPFERGDGMGSMGAIAGYFVQALAEGKQPMTPGTDALEVTRVIDAAYRSASEQTMVTLA